MKRQKIVTFGELLLRFSKPDHQRLTQGDMFTSKYGGSEANVAVSLATLGEDVTYITRLPDTPVGHAGAMCLAQLGVDTSHVLYGGQRIGTYYFEPAAGMRPAKVIYDRNNSAYYDLKPGMIPWREILKDTLFFHVSGITAAISQQAADATFEALDIADELGITVCFDINYRKNLWRYGADTLFVNISFNLIYTSSLKYRTKQTAGKTQTRTLIIPDFTNCDKSSFSTALLTALFPQNSHTLQIP